MDRESEQRGGLCVDPAVLPRRQLTKENFSRNNQVPRSHFRTPHISPAAFAERVVALLERVPIVFSPRESSRWWNSHTGSWLGHGLGPIRANCLFLLVLFQLRKAAAT
jgi:hypothetical protein